MIFYQCSNPQCSKGMAPPPLSTRCQRHITKLETVQWFIGQFINVWPNWNKLIDYNKNCFHKYPQIITISITMSLPGDHMHLLIVNNQFPINAPLLICWLLTSCAMGVGRRLRALWVTVLITNYESLGINRHFNTLSKMVLHTYVHFM